MTAPQRDWKVFSAVGALALAALLTAGCSGSETAASATSSAAAPNVTGGAATSGAAAASSAALGSAADAAGGQAAPPKVITALDNRQVIKTADLQIRLTIGADIADDKFEAAAAASIDAAVANARAQAITSEGFVADLKQSTSSASMVIRVPAKNYESYRSAAAKLGEVTSNTESAQDVTDEYTDVASRIKTMQTSVDRLRALLAQAVNVADVISLESELTSREAEMESLQGRLAVLTDQVSLATLSISFTAGRAVTTTTEPVTPKRGGFLGGLAAGWDALLTFFTGLGVVLGAVLPFLPVVAVIGLAVWLWLRRARSRRGTENQGAPLTPPTTA